MQNHIYILTLKSQEANTMKALSLISALLIILFLSSCSSSKQVASYDEVYATTTHARTATSASYDRVNVESAPVGETSAYQGDYLSEEYTDEDFDPEGYYDYEYSSRLKRFHSDSQGFDYYDNYYTNTSNYSDESYGCGNSIYSGCGCYSSSCYGGYSGLSVSLGFGFGWGGFGFGWGYPYYGYGWGYPYYGYGWGYPYYRYGWGYPYYGYGWGYGGSYWNGYWDGYYAGGGSYYNNPYDYNSYYGPRVNRSGPSDGSGRAYRSEGYTSDENLAYAGTDKTARTSRPLVTDPTSHERSTATTGKVKREEPSSQGKTTRQYSSKTRRVDLPAQKYEKPKTYVSPKARTTPSSNEYSTPKARGSSNYANAGTTTRKTYTTKAERRPVNVANSGNSRSSVNSPSRSSGNRTYSSPTRSSGKSYSSPSRSSGKSYSSPSRSSSGGSGRSVGGSSGGGSRSSGGGGASRSGGGGGSRSSGGGGSSSSSSRGSR